MGNKFVQSVRAHRVISLMTLDSCAWLVAVFVATGLRLDTLDISPTLHIAASRGDIPLGGALIIALVAAVCHNAFAWFLRLPHGRNAIGGFEEVFAIGSTIFASGVVVTIANAVLAQSLVPRTSVLVASMIAFILACWPRALWRVLVTQARPNKFGVVTQPVIIVGAGSAGRDLVGSMQRDPRQTWTPVAFVDDDPRKKHFRHRGVAVEGTTHDLGRIAVRHAVDTVVLAMPSLDSTSLKKLYDRARAVDLNVKVLPGVNELLDGARMSDVRDIAPEDLLGRHQVRTDIESIAEYLTGRRVLVTGAGGSIGSELCRQIHRFAPAELIMLDRDESALHALLLSIDGKADLDSPNVVLANIREADRMREVFSEHRPEVVFHAAALKHVNMLERHPGEAVKTNVIGTQNVLDAAAEFGVTRFVNISTDKAADPENALGYSKRIAELQTAHHGLTADGTYISVRFGNVLGTRGSVLKTFASQIKAGGPVTVTDPDVTRYFMTVDEAVQLVIQAAAIGRDGEVLVLDMGEPKKILDVAHQMIDQSGERIPIIITGLKPGEKLHEVLFGKDEVDERPVHPLVSHVAVPRNHVVEGLVETNTDASLDAMRKICQSVKLHPGDSDTVSANYSG